jgi:hypothetical protein
LPLSSSFPPQPFKYGFVKRKREISEGGCAVILVFVKTDETKRREAKQGEGLKDVNIQEG